MAELPANPGNEGQPRPDDVSTVRDSQAMLRGEQNDPLIGTTVGQYTIKRVIGSGGMGTVYEALQQSPRRTVALKMMKQGIASRNALRRFEYEAQTLGRLRHDNIAQIYEASTHDDGSGARPFFAMEYLIGAKPLTTYAADKKFGTRERLELFSKVCDAVQHGHQKGIIHRDLKPPNILVTSSGVPKIIDFGVARSTDSDMAVTTLQTDVGALIGTLQYMSPEQCAADPNDIDTRSDVYALGVILYELLCDSLPYDLTRVAIAEAARIVQQEEPTKPSTVDKRLRGDVETIALKALEKDRDRRYQSATALEDDINRYLAGDPITAKAPSAIDYLRRFARKHKAAAISIAAIFVVLVGAVIAISIFAAEAQRQRQESEHLTMVLFASEVALQDEVKKAEQTQAEAEQEAQRAITSLNFLSEMLTFDPVEAESLDTGMVKQMLANAESQLGPAIEGQPLVEASVRQIIGNSYLGLTMLEEAEPHLIKAMKIREELRPPDHIEVLESKYNMGLLHKTQGRYAEAEPYYREALEGYRSVLGDDHEDTLWTLTALGKLLQEDERYKEAEEVYLEALQTSRYALGNEARHTITAMANLGDLFYILARYDEAFDLYKEAHNASMSLYGSRDRDPDPRHMRQITNMIKLIAFRGQYDTAELMSLDVLKYNRKLYGPQHYRTLISLENVGNIITKRGRYQDAEPFYREAMETRLSVLGNKHKDTQRSSIKLADNLRKWAKYDEAERLYRGVVETNPDSSNAKHMMGDLLRDQGLYPEALAFYVDAQSIVEHEHGRESNFMVEPLTKTGQLFMDMGQYEEAELQLREAEKLLEELLEEDHPSVLDVRSKIVVLRLHQGRFDEASSILQEVFNRRRDVLGTEHPDTLKSIENMGYLLQAQGNYKEAMPYYAWAVAGNRQLLGSDHPSTLNSINNMGLLLVDQEAYGEAEPYLREALDTRRRVLGAEHPDTTISVNSVGYLLSKQSRFDEARPYYQESLDARRRTLGDEHPSTLTAINNMGGLLRRQGKYDEAMPYLKEAMEAQRRILSDEHPLTLISINNVGALYRLQGHYNEAESFIRMALAGRRRVLGDEHPATLTSLNNLAVLLARQGKYEDAEQYAREAMETKRLKWGNEHRKTLLEITNLASLLAKQGEYDEASRYCLEAIEGWRRTLGDEHPQTHKAIEGMILIHDEWHKAEPTVGHDVTAAEYRALLEAIEAREAEPDEPAVP